MQTKLETNPAIAVIGAGPAGIYAAESLAKAGAEVALINRDIRPGGLAEYGIYHSKHKMKAGLRKQFKKILKHPNIHYYGNITISEDQPLKLNQLISMGFDAVLVTVGAQGTKWLDMEGESLTGVYHAKDLVYHYNSLPSFSEQDYRIGKRVAIVGVGNVMIDIARWAIRDLHVDEVIAIARRGAADVKFTKKEMQEVASNLDLEALDSEMNRIEERMVNAGQDPESAKAFILSALKKAEDPVSESKMTFRFLSTPREIVGDESGKVNGILLENNKLEPSSSGRLKPVSQGAPTLLPVDTVVFAIGDVVDRSFGLPTEWGSFSKNPKPSYPIEGISYEAYDPELEQPLPGYFVAGWAREASSGLVGAARKDGKSGADAVMAYLADQPAGEDGSAVINRFEEKLQELNLDPIDFSKWELIEQQEVELEAANAVDHFRFGTNQEMITALNKALESQPNSIPGD